MNTRKKFTAALQRIADEREVDLIVDGTYANTGTYRFQARDSFAPLLEFSFNFQSDYTSLGPSGANDGPLGPRGGGRRGWGYLRTGGELDEAIERIKETLDRDRPSCPNCGQWHGPIDACFLGMLAQCVQDRTGVDITIEHLRELEVGIEDEMWNAFGGPATDWLEDALKTQTNAFAQEGANT